MFVSSSRSNDTVVNNPIKASISTKESMIDFKQFLNSVIKTLSHEHFDSDIFIVEQFWKSKFDSSQANISIEMFNQAFYQFFSKDTKLLTVDIIDEVTNECFQYALKKNRKYISQRHLKKVIKRQFSKVLSESLEKLQNVKEYTNSNSKQKDKLQNIEQLSRENTMNGHIQTYFQDSLDNKSFQQRAQKRFSSNSSRMNLDTNFISMLNRTQEKESSYQENKRSKSTNAKDNFRPSALKLLAYSLDKIMNNAINRISFRSILKFSKYQRKKVTQMELISEKENISMQLKSNDGSSKGRLRNQREPLQEKQTFSFNQEGIQLTQDSSSGSLQNIGGFEFETNNDFKHPSHLIGKDKQMMAIARRNIQSNGSLCYSNTPTNRNFYNLQKQSNNIDVQRQSCQEYNSTKNAFSSQVMRLHQDQQIREGTNRISIPMVNAFNQYKSKDIQQTENDSCIIEYQRLFDQNRPSSRTKEVKLSSKLTKTSGNRSSNTLKLGHKLPDFTSDSRVSTAGYQYLTNNSNNIIYDNEKPPYSTSNNRTSKSYIASIQDHNSILSENQQTNDQSISQEDQNKLDISRKAKSIVKQERSKSKRYEKKYRQTKQKLKGMAATQSEGIRKYEDMNKSNKVFEDKVASLEYLNDQIQEQLQISLGQNEQMYQTVRTMGFKIGLKSLSLIQEGHQQKCMHQKFSEWNKKTKQDKQRNNYLEKYKDQKSCKLMTSALHFWKLYVIDRLRRKEKRKVKKIQVKVLKMVLKRQMMRRKEKSFSQWKNQMWDHNIVEQAQHDIMYANDQIRMMRTVLSLSKLQKLSNSYSYRVKCRGFYQMKSNLLVSADNLQRKPQISRKQNHLVSPQNRRSLPPTSGRSTSLTLTKTSNINEQRNSNSNYKMKSDQQRLQRNVCEGMEKLYLIKKRQITMMKERSFQKWKITEQNDTQSHQFYSNQKQPEHFQKIQFVSPQLLDLESSLEYPQSNPPPPYLQANREQYGQQQQQQPQQKTQVIEPCYYKTNEGYFYLNNHQLVKLYFSQSFDDRQLQQLIYDEPSIILRHLIHDSAALDRCQESEFQYRQ